MNRKKCLLIMGGTLGYAGVPNVLKTIIQNTSDCIDYTLVIATGEHPRYNEFAELGIRFEYLNHAMPRNRLLRSVWFYGYRLPYLGHQVKRMMKEPYDAVYCVSGLVEGVYLRIAARKKIPVRIAHCHGKISKDSGWLSRCQKQYLRHLIEKYATQKITCSTEAGKTFFLNDQDVKTLINPVQIEEYADVQTVSSEQIRMLQIGYFGGVKNQKFSLKLLSYMVDQGQNVKLTLIGYQTDPTYYSEMMADIAQNKLEPYVEFLPSDYDKKTAFANTDLLLLPSKSEACPLVALEAQAAHIPVCASANVPTDVDFGMCEFMDTYDVEKWCDTVLKMKHHTYIRKDSFSELDEQSFGKKISTLIEGNII